jgi:hypothetical protein
MGIAFSTLNHGLRVPLAAEIHSRPFLKLEAPEAISHFAVYRNGENGPPNSNAHWQHLLLAGCAPSSAWRRRRRDLIAFTTTSGAFG